MKVFAYGNKVGQFTKVRPVFTRQFTLATKFPDDIAYLFAVFNFESIGNS